LNRSFYRSYKIPTTIEVFKRRIRAQVLETSKYRPSIFNKDDQYFYGRFSGLYGRRLNLKKISNPKITLSLFKSKRLEGPGLEIKCKIEPTESDYFIYNVQFKSIAFYFLWGPIFIMTIFWSMLSYIFYIINNDLDFLFLVIPLSIIYLIYLIFAIPMVLTLKKDFYNFEQLFENGLIEVY
jgi:hypothetical protein